MIINSGEGKYLNKIIRTLRLNLTDRNPVLARYYENILSTCELDIFSIKIRAIEFAEKNTELNQPYTYYIVLYIRE